MTSGTRFTRRTAIATAAASAIGAGILAWAPPSLAVSRKDENSWESVDGALTITYDPAIWSDISVSSEPSNGLTLATDPTYGRPRYWLSIGSGDAIWSSVDDAAANAQAAWFSQGMNGSVVTREFTTKTGYGWIHYADFQGKPRTVSVMQYALDGDGGMITIMLSIDADAFADLDIDDAFDAVSLNGDPVFMIASQRTMIRAITDAFDA